MPSDEHCGKCDSPLGGTTYAGPEGLICHSCYTDLDDAEQEDYHDTRGMKPSVVSKLAGLLPSMYDVQLEADDEVQGADTADSTDHPEEVSADVE